MTDTLTEYIAEEISETAPDDIHIVLAHGSCVERALWEHPGRLYRALCGVAKRLSAEDTGDSATCEQCTLLYVAIPIDMKRCMLCGKDARGRT